MDRRQTLISHVDLLSERGLELGPLDKPLVSRSESSLIYYCDYASREALRESSKHDPNVNIDNIPEIDFVVGAIGPDSFGGMKFDYVIASHVIEHVPDVITWLNVLLASLNPGGRIVLAIPDRRYTFDYLRPVSTTGQLLEAMMEQRKRPSAAQIYDGFSKAVDVNSYDLWQSGPYPRSMNPLFTKDTALNLARDVFENGTYRDCHCWVFEHAVFLSIVAELRDLGYLDVHIAHHTPPAYGSNEFHIVFIPR